MQGIIHNGSDTRTHIHDDELLGCALAQNLHQAQLLLERYRDEGFSGPLEPSLLDKAVAATPVQFVRFNFSPQNNEIHELNTYCNIMYLGALLCPRVRSISSCHNDETTYNLDTINHQILPTKRYRRPPRRR